MPPIRSQSSVNLAGQEGNILLAIQALKNWDISNITAAARIFKIPRSTLRDRLNGHTQRGITRANSCKLSEIEEETLEKWIPEDLLPGLLWCEKWRMFSSRSAESPRYLRSAKNGYITLLNDALFYPLGFRNGITTSVRNIRIRRL